MFRILIACLRDCGGRLVSNACPIFCHEVNCQLLRSFHSVVAGRISSQAYYIFFSVCPAFYSTAYSPISTSSFSKVFFIIKAFPEFLLCPSIRSGVGQSSSSSLTSGLLDLRNWCTSTFSSQCVSVPSFSWTFKSSDWDLIFPFASSVVCANLSPVPHLSLSAISPSDA